MMNATLFAVVVATSLAIAGTFVNACSCFPRPNVYNSYNAQSTTAVLQARVVRELPNGVDENNPDSRFADKYYLVKIRRMLQSCPLLTEETRKVVVTTSGNSCGVRLSDGEKYLLFGRATDEERRGLPTYSIFGCDYNVKWSGLSKQERRFLLDQEFECDGQSYCANGNHGNLLLRCDVECPSCPVGEELDENVVCETSLCGGCGTDGAQLLLREESAPLEETLSPIRIKDACV